MGRARLTASLQSALPLGLCFVGAMVSTACIGYDDRAGDVRSAPRSSLRPSAFGLPDFGSSPEMVREACRGPISRTDGGALTCASNADPPLAPFSATFSFCGKVLCHIVLYRSGPVDDKALATVLDHVKRMYGPPDSIENNQIPCELPARSDKWTFSDGSLLNVGIYCFPQSGDNAHLVVLFRRRGDVAR